LTQDATKRKKNKNGKVTEREDGKKSTSNIAGGVVGRRGGNG